MVQRTRAAGDILAERYRLEALLGTGGFGTVWRAQHLVLEAPVAVKLIDPDIAQDELAVERFLREAKAAASLRSAHVVRSSTTASTKSSRSSRWNCSRARPCSSASSAWASSSRGIWCAS
jgi:serine/threonine protein kinase